MKINDLQGRLDAPGAAALNSWAKSKTAAKVSAAVVKCAALGAKNRNGRIGLVEVKRATSSK